MAKRKRLSPTPGLETATGAPEAKALTRFPMGVQQTHSRQAPPVSHIAGDAAAHAALEELSDVLNEAREEGRLILRLPLEAIEVDHLVRDRLSFDAEEMETLKASIAARGQQTPVEVVSLGNDHYGLISGWRRIEALRQLGEAEVLALVRAPEGAAGAYLAMIEENEIRANLSFYERARLASEAARIGVYPTVNRAVADLFAAAPSAKRSKILKFVTLHEKLGDVLSFPSAIPERLGLALTAELETNSGFLPRLRDRLRKTPAIDAAGERAQLEYALKGGGKPARKTPAPKGVQVSPGVYLDTKKGKAVVAGTGVDARLLEDLRAWLAARN